MPKPIAVRLILLSCAAALLVAMMSTLHYNWNWWVVWQYRDLFIQGFANTIMVSCGAIVLGLVIGVLGGLARVSENVWFKELATLYVWGFRGTPLLTQIYIFYFCFAVMVHVDSPFLTGMVTLAFFAGAYITEMVRAGIESISPGQWEAARSSGLTHGQALRHVVFPQALRRIIPPVTGQFVSLIKDSSLLSVIAVRELTKGAEIVNSITYKTFEAYLPLAVFYLLLTYPLSILTYHLEKRITYQSAPRSRTPAKPKGAVP
ncbi:amino acid ABC transporter permease [Fundidesulfovibrio terrae]|uniref:amino acid ABC transporter permease n=1 Tax=Fundidesulfovibrio terrae TaxID=2922866 RepID=UPI001FB03698|nr:amino acid ABC transporter permease [Fundidesulfovibrio terrae]